MFWIVTPYQACGLQIFSPIQQVFFCFFFVFFFYPLLSRSILFNALYLLVFALVAIVFLAKSPKVHKKCEIKELCCCCSVAQQCPTLCSPMDCRMPGFPVLHHLSELAQTHVHAFGDAIQTHPLSSLSPPAFNLSQHQGLFQ